MIKFVRGSEQKLLMYGEQRQQKHLSEICARRSVDCYVSKEKDCHNDNDTAKLGFFRM